MQRVFDGLLSITEQVRRSNGTLCACLELEDGSMLYLDYVSGDWVIANGLLPKRFVQVLGGVALSVYIHVHAPQAVRPGRKIWLTVGGMQSQSVITTYKLARITLVDRKTVKRPIDITLTRI